MSESTSVETVILLAECESCKYSWRPFGATPHRVPYTTRLECPKCHVEHTMTWGDSEIQRLLAMKRVGIEPDAGILSTRVQKQVDELVRRVNLIDARLETEKAQREFTDTKLKEFDAWAKKREQDFLDIERIAQELNEEEEYRKGGT